MCFSSCEDVSLSCFVGSKSVWVETVFITSTFLHKKIYSFNWKENVDKYEYYLLAQCPYWVVIDNADSRIGEIVATAWTAVCFCCHYFSLSFCPFWFRQQLLLLIAFCVASYGCHGNSILPYAWQYTLHIDVFTKLVSYSNIQIYCLYFE